VTHTETTHQEILQACTHDCQAAREAIAAAREILHAEDSGRSWAIQFWEIASPPGEIRLTWGGCAPSGRVPASFRRKWWLAVADAALAEVQEIGRQERL
jgi:hypothetical protein